MQWVSKSDNNHTACETPNTDNMNQSPQSDSTEWTVSGT